MSSGAGAAAEGIQAGWGMGLQYDKLQLEKQQLERDTALRQRSADREDQQFGMTTALAQANALKAQRDEIGATATALRQQGKNDEADALGDQWNTLNAAHGSAMARVAGTPAPGPLAPPASTPGTGTAPVAPAPAPAAAPATPEQAHVAAVDQHVADLSSRLQTGQIALSEVDPADLAMMVTAATGHPPSQLGQVKTGLQDWHAGMETGNQGLIIKGLNTVYGPQLQQGVGDESPHGGHIVKKEIIGLDPAASGDGSVHTDKVIPRLRITTDVKGPDGQPLHYDAPMTVGRSTDPNDPVKAISVQDAMHQLGQMGTLVTALDHPEIAATALKGEAQAKPAIDQYLAFKAMTTPANPAAAKEQQVRAYMKQYGVDRDTAISQMGDTGAVPYHATRGPVALLEAARDLAAEEGITVTEAMTRLHPNRFMNGVDNAVHPVGKFGNAVGVGAARPAAAASGTGAGVKGTGLVKTAADGTPLTGDDYLKTLAPALAARVRNIAANPALLQNVSTKGDERARLQDMVLQYNPNAKLGKDAGGMTGRESIYANRVLTSANEAAQDLGNIVQTPISASTGFFGGRSQGTSIFAAGRETLTNKMSSQEVQSYNVMATGFHRSLASIESAGLAPSNSLSNQMDAVVFKEGDTQLTKLEKLAQTRQIVEAGLETTLANPKLADEQRAHVKGILASIRESVPFTMKDVIKLKSKWADGDPNASLQSVIGKVKPAAAPAAPAGGASFANDAEAAAAAKAGKIKAGDRITVNGQTGTWH